MSTGDNKNKNGKLRLLYECAPMSFLAEQAGGAGSTGKERVLDVKPEAVHQRVPLYIGSKKEVRADWTLNVIAPAVWVCFCIQDVGSDLA